jgi:plastocyanin
MLFKSVSALLLLGAVVQAKDGEKAASMTVTVGKAGLNFNPNVIHAAVGSTIDFEFYPSVSESNWNQCGSF